MREQYTEKLDMYMKKEGLEGYNKNDPRVAEILQNRRNAAIKNAQRLEESYEMNVPASQKNPCTTVHHLVREIIELERIIDKIKMQERYF